MTIKINAAADMTRVTLGGEIDLAWAGEHAAEIEQLTAAPAPSITFYLGAVTFMDSTGLTMLIGCWRRCRDRGGKVYLSQVPPVVSRLLEVSGLVQVLELGEAPSGRVGPTHGGLTS